VGCGLCVGGKYVGGGLVSVGLAVGLEGRYVGIKGALVRGLESVGLDVGGCGLGDGCGRGLFVGGK